MQKKLQYILIGKKNGSIFFCLCTTTLLVFYVFVLRLNRNRHFDLKEI